MKAKAKQLKVNSSRFPSLQLSWDVNWQHSGNEQLCYDANGAKGQCDESKLPYEGMLLCLRDLDM